VSAEAIQASACEPDRLPVSGFGHWQIQWRSEGDLKSPRSGASTEFVPKAGN